ncbi:MAG: helix-turn-helix transcriptional regulator [Bacillota bacterium]|jgi:putative transcriptional regulator|nr:helix-turn-helix transcriptional regulator [Bacillota bacterium]
MKARQWLINYRGSRTQETVARKIGISRSRLTQIELGDTPSVETAKKIADFYGFSWVIFFEDGCCQKGQQVV